MNLYSFTPRARAEPGRAVLIGRVILKSPVILSAAKDLVGVPRGARMLRFAQHDSVRADNVKSLENEHTA